MKDKLFPSDFEVLDIGIRVDVAMKKYPDSHFLMTNLGNAPDGELTGDIFFVGTQEEQSAIFPRLLGFYGIGMFPGGNILDSWIKNRL